MFLRRQDFGFTLIELVLVIVVLGILALGTTRYIVNSTQSYTVSAERTKLIAGGRVAVEKVARRLRNALPNSVRTDANGHCIEYLPVLAGTSSRNDVTLTPGSVSTASFNLSNTANTFAVIAPLTTSEVYIDAPLPSPGVIAATNFSGNDPFSAIPLANGSHTFLRSSPTDRVYVVGRPERFCINGNVLNFIDEYDIESATPTASSTPSGAVTTLVAENLNISPSSTIPVFDYSPGGLARNAIVEIRLSFIKDGDRVEIAHEVQIRNVP